jgi:hypothetical protein
MPEEEEGTPRATWQDSRDTSTVWAKLKHPNATVVVDGAIPWLLLEVVGSDTGPTGGNRLTETTYIQRVNTEAGLAPPGSGCDLPDDVGKREFVPYKADYIFYKPTRHE